MVKYVCDRCGQIAETSSGYFVYYTGKDEADGCNFCKVCFEEFLNWMKNESFNADKKDSCDWWRALDCTI